MPTTGTDLALLPLLQLADSGAPTGAFSHSFGLETAIASGRVDDATSCAAWLEAYVSGCLALADVLAVRLVHEDALSAADADLVLTTSIAPAETRAGTRTIGRRLLAIARTRFPGPGLLAYAGAVDAGQAEGHPALVLALCGRDHGLAWRGIALVHLMSTVTSLVQGAVRAVPLGQDAGQAVLAGLHPVLGRAVERAAAADPDDLGATTPLVDLDQMAHETLPARMFMS